MAARLEQAPINRTPFGLLGLLDIRSMGVNPRELLDRVQPQIDMFPFYSEPAYLRRASSGVVISATGSFPSDLVVPQGKLWLVRQVVLRTTAALAGASVSQVAVEVQNSNGTYALASGNSSVVSVGQVGQVVLDGPFLMTSGQLLAVQCLQFTAPNHNWFFLAGVIEFDS